MTLDLATARSLVQAHRWRVDDPRITHCRVVCDSCENAEWQPN